jgi:hypothetical protein
LLDEAFLYTRSVDSTTYERQRDKLREEIALARIELDDARLVTEWPDLLAQERPTEGQSHSALGRATWNPLSAVVSQLQSGEPLTGVHPSIAETATLETQITPALALVFQWLGWLEIFGGFVLGLTMLPGDPEPGYTWKAAAYMAATTWMAAGVIFGFLFFAIAEVLKFLKSISDALRRNTTAARSA